MHLPSWDIAWGGKKPLTVNHMAANGISTWIMRVFAPVRMNHWPICHVETKTAPKSHGQWTGRLIDENRHQQDEEERKIEIICRWHYDLRMRSARMCVNRKLIQPSVMWANVTIRLSIKCFSTQINRPFKLPLVLIVNYLLLNIQPVHWTDNHQADVPRPGIYRLFHLMADKTDHSWSSPSVPTKWEKQFILLDLAIRKTAFFSKDAHICTFPCTASNMQKKTKKKPRNENVVFHKFWQINLMHKSHSQSEQSYV